MADYSAIKIAFQERYQADLDVGIVLGFKGDMFSVADVVFNRDSKDVAVKIVREDETIGSISQFFSECQSEGFYPLFLFRAPNSSPQAVVCSYLNSAAFAVDEALRITPFKVDKEGLKVSTRTFSIDDFTCRKSYHINYTIDLFGFSLIWSPRACSSSTPISVTRSRKCPCAMRRTVSSMEFSAV